MHPRNPYQQPPDFRKLAHDYPALTSFLIPDASGATTIDFHNDAALRCLTQALLKRDFGIHITLPPDRLCPPLPNRLNYILWIEDILTSMSSTPEIVFGADIGTGASAIYPLLSCSTHTNWAFVATELDSVSMEIANANIASAGFQDRIKLFQVHDQNTTLEPLFTHFHHQYQFTMCNPPFYASQDEIDQSATEKRLHPSAVCTGTSNEMITPGGESDFVSKMIRSSTNFRSSSRWFTSMLGKLSSLHVVVALFKELEIDNYALTEFVQGHTRRWAVAWSFELDRLPDNLARSVSNSSLRSLLPPKNTLQRTIPIRHPHSDPQILRNALQSIPEITIEAADNSFMVHAAADTWSRRARRRKNPTVAPASDTTLTCTVSLQPHENQAAILTCQRLRGGTYSLFETFFSHLSQKITTAM